MDSCAANGTVVATVATSWEAARVRALAASVARAGFGCLVVQSNAPQPQMAGQHVVLLPPPVPALVPRRRWCRRQALYARRLRELHQALLWRIVLDSRLDLLAVDTELVLVSSPLPHTLVRKLNGRTMGVDLGRTNENLLSVSETHARHR